MCAGEKGQRHPWLPIVFAGACDHVGTALLLLLHSASRITGPKSRLYKAPRPRIAFEDPLSALMLDAVGVFGAEAAVENEGGCAFMGP